MGLLYVAQKEEQGGGMIARVEAGDDDKGSYAEGSHGEGGDDRDDAREEDKEEGRGRRVCPWSS